jgi:hypothetical protein
MKRKCDTRRVGGRACVGKSVTLVQDFVHPRTDEQMNGWTDESLRGKSQKDKEKWKANFFLKLIKKYFVFPKKKEKKAFFSRFSTLLDGSLNF